MVLTFFSGYESQLQSLVLYTIAIVIYVIIIGVFYQKLSRRTPIKLTLLQDKKSRARWIAKYIVVLPTFSFLWFAILAGVMFFLAKSQTAEQILLISMTLVAATRVTAYINQDMSTDLAKLVPLAMLAVFLVDPSFFSIEASLNRVGTAFTLGELVLRYFVFVVVLEFVLRSVYHVVTSSKARKVTT